jgi:hypothetical protein
LWKKVSPSLIRSLVGGAVLAGVGLVGHGGRGHLAVVGGGDLLGVVDRVRGAARTAWVDALVDEVAGLVVADVGPGSAGFGAGAANTGAAGATSDSAARVATSP